MRSKAMIFVALCLIVAGYVYWQKSATPSLDAKVENPKAKNETGSVQKQNQPEKSKINLKDSANPVLDLVNCIQDKSCLPGEDEASPYYDEKSTEPFLQLKDLLQANIDEGQNKTLSADVLFQIIELQESDSQILATQILFRDYLSKDMLDKFKQSFVQFTNESSKVVIEYLGSIKNSEAKALLSRAQIIELAQTWLVGEENSPIDFLEARVFEKISKDESRLLAKSLCYVETNPKMKHLRKYVSSKVDLTDCQSSK